MDTREELIKKINFSEEALTRMLEYQKKRSLFLKQQSDALRRQDAIESSKAKLFTTKDKITDTVIGIVTVALFFYLIPFYFSLFICSAFNITDTEKVKLVMEVCGVISIVAGILITVFRRIHYKKAVKPKLLAEVRKELDVIDARLETCRNEIADYAATDEWKTATSYVPKDYFYMSALEKFKYYLENGHADNMKEALRLYDEYLHRKKLEKEARRAADNAEVSAEYARITSEKAASIEFWSIVNAYTTEEIYRKLN